MLGSLWNILNQNHSEQKLPNRGNFPRMWLHFAAFLSHFKLNLNHFQIWAFRSACEVLCKCHHTPKSGEKIYPSILKWTSAYLFETYSCYYEFIHHNYPSLQIQHMCSCILPKDHFFQSKVEDLLEKKWELWTVRYSVILWGNISFEIALYNIIKVIIFLKDSFRFMFPVIARLLHSLRDLFFFFFLNKVEKNVHLPYFAKVPNMGKCVCEWDAEGRQNKPDLWLLSKKCLYHWFWSKWNPWTHAKFSKGKSSFKDDGPVFWCKIHKLSKFLEVKFSDTLHMDVLTWSTLWSK